MNAVLPTPLHWLTTVGSLSDRIVTVLVGDTKAKFQVHENALKQHSTFFVAALSKGWRERRSGEVHLPEDKPELVKLYLQFLYSQKIGIAWTKTREGLPQNDLLPEYVTLAHLFVLGEKLIDTHFTNAVVRAFLRRRATLVEGKRYSPVGEAVDIIYNGTPSGSKMRQLLVDDHAGRGWPHWIQSETERPNAEFLYELAVAMMSKSDKGRVYRLEDDTRTVTEMQDGRYEESERSSEA